MAAMKLSSGRDGALRRPARVAESSGCEDHSRGERALDTAARCPYPVRQ